MDLLTHDGVGSDRAANLALEEALARAGPPRPVLRLWRNHRCVVLGRAQRPEREVDLATCAADAVPVLRRSSGGGTVYQDLGNLNITVAVPGSVPGLHLLLAQLVADALSGLGLTPAAGDRGVHVGPAKVSGLASQVTRTGSIGHATLLVATPPAAVAAYLAPAPADRRPTDSRRGPVAALAGLIPGFTVADARAAVLAAAARLDGPLAPRPRTGPERRWQERLLAERYRRDSWHLSGHTKETPWTTRPASTSIG